MLAVKYLADALYQAEDLQSGNLLGDLLRTECWIQLSGIYNTAGAGVGEKETFSVEICC